MSNRIASLPDTPGNPLLDRHYGRITSYDELQIDPVGNDYTLDGSGTITRLPCYTSGTTVWLKVTGSPTFTHSARLICPNGRDYLANPGDLIVARSSGDGIWSIHVLAAVDGPIFSFEGDSLTATTANGKWPLYLAANHAFFARGTSNYFALGGDTAASMVGEYASQAGAVKVRGREAYFFLYAGTNDVAGSAAAATIYGYLSTIWAAARATGYKVVAFTIPPRGDITSAQNLIRAELNRLILSDATLYDFVVRADEVLTDPNNTENFLDTIHLTTAGNILLAKAVAAAVLNVSPVYATPFEGTPGGIQINGGFEINQKYGSAAITGLTSTAARVMDNIWLHANGPAVVTAQQVADAPAGLTNSLKLSVTTADATLAVGSFVLVRIPFLGYRTARLGFGTGSAKALACLFFTKHHRPGTYGGSIRNAAVNRSYPFTYTQSVADTWEAHQVIIPGDQTGTWIGNTSGVGLTLFLAAACASNLSGAANAWAAANYASATGAVNGVAATSDVFQVAGLFCTAGNVLPPSMQIGRILRPFNEELLLCQRQYCSDFPYGTTPANNVQLNRRVAICNIANSLKLERIPFPATMIAVPTPTLFSSNAKASPTANQWQYMNNAGAWTDGSGISIDGATVDDFQVQLTAVSTAQGGYMVGGSWEADVSPF